MVQVTYRTLPLFATSCMLVATGSSPVHADYAWEAIEALQSSFFVDSFNIDLSTPHYKNIEYWINAAVLDAVLAYGMKNSTAAPFARWLESEMFRSSSDVIDSFGGMLNLQSNSMDDPLWWCLAYLSKYELDADTGALDAAEEVFNYVYECAWDTETCGGGLWWTACGLRLQTVSTPDKTYKNAITNSLAMQAAARLAKHGKGEAYAEKAVAIWSWIEGSGMVSSSGAVVDGMNSDDPDNCYATGGTYTYNSGVPLYGLAVLAEINNDTSFIDAAVKIADYALEQYTLDDGIMYEPYGCDSYDTEAFKGIFVHYLANLRDSPMFTDMKRKDTYNTFLKTNADNLALVSRDASTELYSGDWASAPTATDKEEHERGNWYQQQRVKRYMRVLNAAGIVVNTTTTTTTTDTVPMESVCCTSPDAGTQGSAINLLTAAYGLSASEFEN